MVSQNLEALEGPENSSFVISNILENNLADLVSMDEMVFGANRFKLLHFLMNNQKDIALQIEKDGKLRGYVLGRKGSNYTQVGPVITNGVQSAKLLLHDVFIKLRQTPTVIDVLLDKPELIDWLLSIGFTQQRDFTRMSLGSQTVSPNTALQFAISGPELG